MADINSSLPVTDTTDGVLGATAPTSAQQIAGKDGSGNLQVPLIDAQRGIVISGEGTAGSNIGGVLTVQGNASGVALPISAVSLPLPTGAATSANQTNASQKTQIVDGAGLVIGPSVIGGGTGNNFPICISATNYAVSTVNTSVAQLAAGATFTGGIETVFNQQSYSILITCDQPGTLTINQYIDAAGVFKASSQSFTLLPGQGLARSGVVNGNYVNLTFQNIGIATTTTFNLNTAYGTIDAATSLNNHPVSLNEVNGIPITSSPYGAIAISAEAKSLFNDTFDSSGLDTTNRWNTPVGSGTTTQSLGTLTLATNTSASTAIALSSQFSFAPLGLNFLELGCIAQIEGTPTITNTHRFWGVGTPNPSYAAATPLLNAVGFEIDTSGNFNAVIYSNATKVFSQNLNSSKIFISGVPGILGLTFRADIAYFFVGNTQIPLATSVLITPDSLILPIRLHVINHTTPPATAPTFKTQGLGVGDTGGNSFSISDGQYQWRKAVVTNLGSLSVTHTDGYKATYSASATTLAPTTTAPTDIFNILGSATKTIRITRVSVSSTSGGLGGQTNDVVLIKRSTANSGGTSTVLTAGKHDSLDAAATAVVKSYTANPTLGTSAGTIRAVKNYMPNGGNVAIITSWDFGNSSGKAVVLRGVAESLSINLNATNTNSTSFDISIEWTEE